MEGGGILGEYGQAETEVWVEGRRREGERGRREGERGRREGERGRREEVEGKKPKVGDMLTLSDLPSP